MSGIAHTAAALGLVALAGPASAAEEPDAAARLLAGLDHPIPLSEAKGRRWDRYAATFAERWRSYDESLRQPALRWAETSVPRGDVDDVLYLFSGPDLITSLTLYPSARRHVLVGLERAGRLPSLHEAADLVFAQGLRFLERGLEDFVRDGFFVTSHLDRWTQHEPAVRGVTPVLAIFAARAGYRVLSVSPLEIAADGSGVRVLEPAPAGRKSWDSVRLELAREGGATVLVDYLRLDLSDRGLDRHSGATAWLAQAASGRVLLKAASHLLQTPHFSRAREILFERATSVVQDETGLPWTGLRDRFEVRLHGDYREQHQQFFLAEQPELRAAFENRDQVLPLPFRYGYPKKPGSCVIVAHARKP